VISVSYCVVVTFSPSTSYRYKYRGLIFHSFFLLYYLSHLFFFSATHTMSDLYLEPYVEIVSHDNSSEFVEPFVEISTRTRSREGNLIISHLETSDISFR